jgi:hypothetical protein
MRKGNVARVLATGLGGLLLTGVAGLAFADDTEQGDASVDVLIEVTELEGPGTLSISVAGDQTVLTEDQSNADPAVRVFTGVLPDVTVTDTREAGDIDPEAMWYVLGSATNFVDDAAVPVNPDIPVERFGWAPVLDDSVDPGEVSEGDAVLTSYDSGPGLVDQELFAIASNSAAINPTGSWTARADLVLKADHDVAPGSYKSVLTLSLFE